MISVSVWGSSSDLFEIKKILKSKNIYLLEDAAEGLGSYCISNKKKKHLGTFGTLGCISFNLNKIITTGGGGIILTDNKRLALKAKYLSLQAKDNPLKWIHNEVGYNFGLSNLHAAIGLAQLLKLKKIKSVALDVFNKEPYSGKFQLLENTILTPHIGSYAKEIRLAMEKEAIKSIIKN